MRIFVVASGPSLTREQTRKINNFAQKHSQTEIKTMAVSDSYLWLDNPTYIYASDYRWWDRHIENIRSLRKDAVLFSGSKEASERFNLAYMPIKSTNGYHEWPFISSGYNSGHAALHVTAHVLNVIGKDVPKEMVLVGFDYQRKEGEKAHFFGDHPKGWPNAGEWRKWHRPLEILVKGIQKNGIKITNCSKETAITCIPRGDLDNFIY